MNWFLSNSSVGARIVRTLAEVAVSWLLANIGEIFNLFTLDATVKALVISFMTVILTAVVGVINDIRSEKEIANDNING